MKKSSTMLGRVILVTILLVGSLILFSCEKVGMDGTPTHNELCKDRLDQHIKLWDSLYKLGGVSDENMNHIMNQVQEEYKQCIKSK